MYNIYSFPTERLSSETVFTQIQALSIFSDDLQIKGWVVGKIGGLFQTLNRTQYTAVQKKQLRVAIAVRMKKNEEWERHATAQRLQIRANNYTSPLAVPISLESKISSGSKLRMTVYFLWFIKFWPHR